MDHNTKKVLSEMTIHYVYLYHQNEEVPENAEISAGDNGYAP
ncbi:hypothetical protein [Ruminococcus flavefaciens]